MLTVYASSAGSGKTFTLTKEYLKLCLADHPNADGVPVFSAYYFRHILAVTFTNDAANEMKSRIIQALRSMAHYEELSAEERKKIEAIRTAIFEEINATPGQRTLSENEFQQRCGRLFTALLHGYSRFSVSTIDSFTQRVVAAFSEELGLPFNFEVNLEGDLLVAAGVEQMLSRVGQEAFADMTRVMEEFVQEATEQNRSWNFFPEDIAAFGKKLLEDKNHAALLRLQDFDTTDLMAVLQQIKAYRRGVLERFNALADRGLELIRQSDALDYSCFFQGQRGVPGYLMANRSGQPDAFGKPAGSYVMKALTEDVWYARNARPAIREAIDAIKDELGGLLGEMITLQEAAAPRMVLYGELEKHLHKLALLSQLEREIRDMEDLSGQIHISRFNKAVVEIVLAEPVPFLYERLGDRYHHILIDEFQDTSTLQWLNFMPLIDNSLASGNFNLIVGDAKQSIYRFRGGEMQQLMYLHKGSLAAMLPLDHAGGGFLAERLLSLEQNIRPEALTTNRRSRREIVEFNNAFFRMVVESQQVAAPDSLAPHIYDAFEQQVPANAAAGGHVEIALLQKDTEAEDAAQMLHHVWAVVNECLADGYHPGDIAVLCRFNREARLVANFLKEQHLPDGSPMRLSSQDSLQLTFSEAVNLLVAVMRVLDSPDNRLARYEAAYLFYTLVRREVPDSATNAAISLMVESPRPASFFRFFEERGLLLNGPRLRRAGLYELVEGLAGQMHLFDRPGEAPYLFRFLDLVHQFTVRDTGHLADFLAWWEQQASKQTIATPANADAITVQSVHKSKGLEYPVVIVPYASWRWSSSRDQWWGDLEAEHFADYDELNVPARIDTDRPARRLPTAPFRTIKDLTQTPLAPVVEGELDLQLLDSLNALYVALTRPTERLYIALEAKINEKNNQPVFKPDSVGRYFLLFLGEKWNIGRTRFLLHKGTSPGPAHQPATPGDVLVLRPVISHDRTDTVRLRRQADRLFELDEFQQKDPWATHARAILREISTLDEVNMALDRMRYRGLLTDAEEQALRGRLRELFKNNELRQWFSGKDHFTPGQEIMLPGGRATHPDRLLTRPDGSATVLEFKTTDLTDRHRSDLNRTLRLVQEAGFFPVEGILVNLQRGELERLGQ